MTYLSDWKEWEEGSARARAANPLCDESATCPAPDDGHLVGCRANRIRLGMLPVHDPAPCCGRAICNSECKAVIHHGPGHQSRTHCHVKGEHDVHEAVYGSMQEHATWRGGDVFSGFFDNPPDVDDE